MIGTHLKSIRTKKGWTQVQLSQASGIRQGELTYYENNLRIPTAPKLAALAKALAIPMEALMDGAQEISIPEAGAEQLIHGNSTAAQLQKIATMLDHEHQKSLLHHAKLLMLAQEAEQAQKASKRTRKVA